MSVVVMGYRNDDSIVNAIRSVVEQETGEPFEVVVVTSGDDRSKALVAASFPDIRLEASLSRLMPGTARNMGVGMARGEIVAFLAGDCVARPGWIEARLRRHRQGFRAVASAVCTPEPASLRTRAYLFTLFPARLATRPAGVLGPNDPGAHGLSLERSLIAKVGGFDESVRIGEDTRLSARLTAMGIPVWFEPHVQTDHRAPGTRVDIVRDLYRRGRRIAGHAGITWRGRVWLRYPVAWLGRFLYTISETRRYGGGGLSLVWHAPWLLLMTGVITAGYARRQRELHREEKA